MSVPTRGAARRTPGVFSAYDLSEFMCARGFVMLLERALANEGNGGGQNGGSSTAEVVGSETTWKTSK